MNRLPSGIVLIVGGIVLVFTVAFAGSLYSYQDENNQSEVIPMEQYLKYSDSGRLERATFALGWFWGPDSRYGSLDGVIATFAGYAGGEAPDPTYRNIGDHTESFQVVYDPEVISFDDLLELFWERHDPYSGIWLRQYINIAFYENESQKESIELYIRKLEEGGRKVKTLSTRLDNFTLAEDYHQKHSLRRFPEYVRELEAKSPDGDWLFTYEATKLNGYLGGYGSCSALEKEITRFGLSKRLEEQLLNQICSREGRKGVACLLPDRWQVVMGETGSAHISSSLWEFRIGRGVWREVSGHYAWEEYSHDINHY